MARKNTNHDTTFLIVGASFSSVHPDIQSPMASRMQAQQPFVCGCMSKYVSSSDWVLQFQLSVCLVAFPAAPAPLCVCLCVSAPRCRLLQTPSVNGMALACRLASQSAIPSPSRMNQRAAPCFYVFFSLVVNPSTGCVLRVRPPSPPAWGTGKTILASASEKGRKKHCRSRPGCSSHPARCALIRMGASPCLFPAKPAWRKTQCIHLALCSPTLLRQVDSSSLRPPVSPSQSNECL